MSNFLNIIKGSLIPTLERMVLDEEKHLTYLSTVKGIDVSSMQRSSYHTLEHLRERLNQYKTYLRENENEMRYVPK